MRRRRTARLDSPCRTGWCPTRRIQLAQGMPEHCAEEAGSSPSRGPPPFPNPMRAGQVGRSPDGPARLRSPPRMDSPVAEGKWLPEPFCLPHNEFSTPRSQACHANLTGRRRCDPCSDCGGSAREPAGFGSHHRLRRQRRCQPGVAHSARSRIPRHPVKRLPGIAVFRFVSRAGLHYKQIVFIGGTCKTLLDREPDPPQGTGLGAIGNDFWLERRFVPPSEEPDRGVGFCFGLVFGVRA